MVTNTPNNPNQLDIRDLSEDELKENLRIAQDTNNFADIAKYATEMQRRLNPNVDNFDKDYEESVKKIKAGKMTKKEMQDFFLKDITNFKSQTTSTLDSIKKGQQSQIEELQKRLTDSITDLPSMTEYFSLERRRLVKLTQRIQEFKDDKSNYPKNFLIYCMAMTKTKVFGTREVVKRTWTKILRKFKNDDIKGALEILDQKLQDDSKDSKNRKLLKEMLRKEVQEAKKSYVESVKNSVGA